MSTFTVRQLISLLQEIPNPDQPLYTLNKGKDLWDLALGMIEPTQRKLLQKWGWSIQGIQTHPTGIYLLTDIIHVDHPFYQEPSWSRAPGYCDYACEDGSYCDLTEEQHTPITPIPGDDHNPGE